MKTNHDNYLSFRVTKDEKDSIKHDAERQGCTPSQLIRRRVFRRESRPKRATDKTVKAMAKEIKKLEDICTNFPHSDNLDRAIVSINDMLSEVLDMQQVMSNTPAREAYTLYHKDIARSGYYGTIVHQATTNDGWTKFTMEQKSKQGDRRRVEVITRDAIPTNYLTSGCRVVIFGYKDTDKIVADAVRILEDN